MCLECGHLEFLATQQKFDAIHNDLNEEREFAEYIESLKPQLERLEKQEWPKHEKEFAKLQARLANLKTQVGDENITVKKHNELIEDIKKAERNLYDYTSRVDYLDCERKIAYLRKELQTGENYKTKGLTGMVRDARIPLNKKLIEAYLNNHQ